jgi:RNA polymerase sigma factor (sigma-70 family)
MTNSVHQPDISGSLRRIDALVRGASGKAYVEAFNLVVDGLTRATTGEAPKLPLEQFVTLTLAARYPRAGRVARHLVETDAPLDEIITSLTRRGVDGEALCWAVVGYESQHHIKLVWMEANRLAPRFPDRRADELVGWGWLGLRIAVRQFDPGRGFRFSTYACYRIKGAIRDGVRDENPIPKRLLTLQRKISDAESTLGASLGRLPQLAEVVAHLDATLAPLEDLERILPRLGPAASIDEMAAVAAANGTSLPILVDEHDPADDAVEALRREAVRAAVAELDEESREAVELMVWENRSLAEARRMTGLSDRELRRRLDRGRTALAARLADWAPSS